ncbi:hypothetical protein ACS0TY_020265 [Phlomoides rotata]
MSPPRAPPQGAEVQPRYSKRFAAILVLALSIFTVLTVIIIWLSVRPKNLAYSVERSSITGYSFTSAGHLNATFHFLLRSKNSNRRVSFYYDKIDVKRRRNVTDLELSLTAEDVVVRGVVAENLKTERPSGDVKLEVKMSGKIRLKVGLFKVHRSLEVLCGPFQVPFSSSPKRFDRVTCDVDISL